MQFPNNLKIDLVWLGVAYSAFADVQTTKDCPLRFQN